jgi:ElaB/YqjD/DUF883 family membrane-anchored ribosome-binding protein
MDWRSADVWDGCQVAKQMGNPLSRKSLFTLEISRGGNMSREGNIPYDEGMGASEVSEGREREGMSSKIKDKASQFGSTVSQTMDRQREYAAKGLDRAASSLHEGVGSAAKAGHGLADGMSTTASYIRDHSFTDMSNDVMEVCRRHPLQAILSAAALGFLVGRALRR